MNKNINIAVIGLGQIGSYVLNELNTKKKDIETKRIENNIISYNKYYDSNKPNILLNSHHDTVEPNSAYTFNPYEPKVIDKKLYGLGSNDAGGALVSLISTFVYFYNKKHLKHNIILLASAEE